MMVEGAGWGGFGMGWGRWVSCLGKDIAERKGVVYPGEVTEWYFKLDVESVPVENLASVNLVNSVMSALDYIVRGSC